MKFHISMTYILKGMQKQIFLVYEVSSSISSPSNLRVHHFPAENPLFPGLGVYKFSKFSPWSAQSVKSSDAWIIKVFSFQFPFRVFSFQTAKFLLSLRSWKSSKFKILGILHPHSVFYNQCPSSPMSSRFSFFKFSVLNSFDALNLQNPRISNSMVTPQHFPFSVS